MKIFVITSNSWNGEFDCVGVTGEAFFDEKEASRVVSERNSKVTSSYATTYDYHEVEVK